MSTNSISQLVQPNKLQSTAAINNDTSTQNNNALFAMALEEMMNNMSIGNSTNAASSNSNVNNILGSVTNLSGNSGLNGLDSLSLQPQGMAQMIKMLSPENTINTDIGSINDDDTSNTDISDDSSNNDMSQIMDDMLQTVLQNEYNNTQDSSNSSALNNANNIKEATTNL